MGGGALYKSLDKMEEDRDWITQIGENDLTAQTQEKQKFKLGLGVFEIQSKFLTSIQIC